MKVIAKAGDDKVLIEATNTEIWRLLGFENKYEAGNRFSETEVTRVGFEIDIDRIFRMAKFLRTISKEHLDGLDSKLEYLTRGLKEFHELAEKINLLEELKEAGTDDGTS